jgi:N-acetylneuraminate synthase
LYRETHTPREWFPELFAYGKEIGIHVFSSVFDVEEVAYLETIGCPAYKISAVEFGDTALIGATANTDKPIIMSVGENATDSEIRNAHSVAATANENIAYMHCVSRYPCPKGEANLERVIHLRRQSPYWRIGFSDHTPGIEAAVSAVKNYNAQIIEKHITLSRTNGGPDAAFSLEPAAFKQMVEAINA